MAYRSDVYLAMREEDFRRMMDEKEPSTAPYDRHHCLDMVEIKKLKNSDIVVLTWKDIKWYESFPDIAYVMNFLADAAYSFLRVGEDNNMEYFWSMDDGDNGYAEFEDFFNIEVRVTPMCFEFED